MPVAALSIAVAVVTHWVMHAMLDPREAFSAAHGLEAIVAVGVLTFALARLGFGRSRSERRRRVALARSYLPGSAASAVVLALGETALAGALFFTEGTAFDPVRLALALASAAIALIVASITLRTARVRAIGLLLALVDVPIGRMLLPIGAFARRRRSRLTAFRLLRRPRFRGPPSLLLVR